MGDDNDKQKLLESLLPDFEFVEPSFDGNEEIDIPNHETNATSFRLFGHQEQEIQLEEEASIRTPLSCIQRRDSYYFARYQQHLVIDLELTLDLGTPKMTWKGSMLLLYPWKIWSR